MDQFIVLLSQRSKGVEHDTRYDIAEKNSKENAVDHIIWKTHYLELLHGLPYRTRHKQLQDTLDHRLTHLVRRLLPRIDVFHVVAESDSTEDKSKHYSHETHITQLNYVYTNCLENVTDFGNVTEDIHDVQEIYGRIEESSEESDENIH